MNETSYSKTLEELDAIIDNSFKITNNGGEIILTESKNSKKKCKKVVISISNKVFALSLDIQGKSPFNVFNTSKENYTKKNDCILYCLHSKKLIVLLIELKSTHSGDYLKQLKAGKNFSTYLINQINTFSTFNIDKSDIIYRGILFKTAYASPKKGTTKRNKLIFEDRNGLHCTELSCNDIHYLQAIKNSIQLSK